MDKARIVTPSGHSDGPRESLSGGSMVGRRAPDNAKWYGDDSPIQNGDYGRTMVDGEWEWRCRTPNGLGGRLGNHEVTEHEDGTITVSPSILCERGSGGKTYHGFLERGVWRSV